MKYKSAIRILSSFFCHMFSCGCEITIVVTTELFPLMISVALSSFLSLQCFLAGYILS